MLGEEVLRGTKRFQGQGTATILREDTLYSRPWPKHMNTFYLILIPTQGNILILQVRLGKTLQVTQLGGGKDQTGVQTVVH